MHRRALITGIARQNGTYVAELLLYIAHEVRAIMAYRAEVKLRHVPLNF